MMKMKYYLMFFLLTSFMILTSCQGLHSELQEKTVRKNNLEEYYTYYWKNNEEVFHGPCIRKNMNRQFVISDDVRFYLNGKPVGGGPCRIIGSAGWKLR